MGFLSDLFNGRHKQEKAALEEPQRQPVECEAKPILGHIHIEGANTANIYVYDGKPLKGVKKGDRLVLDVISVDVTMKSTLTGTVWSSAESYDIPLAYNGKPIGFTPGVSDVVEELLKRGHTVSVAAKCNGMYAKGIPDLEALVPSRKEAKALLSENTEE